MIRIRKPLVLLDNSSACSDKNVAVLNCKDNGFLSKHKKKKSKKFSTKEDTAFDQENVCIQNCQKYSLRKRLTKNVKETSSRKVMSIVSLNGSNSLQKALQSHVKIKAKMQSNEKAIEQKRSIFSKTETLDSALTKKKSVLREKNIGVHSAEKKVRWLQEEKASPSKEEENLKPDCKFLKKAKCVYARLSPDSAEKGARTRRNQKGYDVYDIAQDEDISYDKPVPKRKRRARVRNGRGKTAENKRPRNRKPETGGAPAEFHMKEGGCLLNVLQAGVECTNIDEGDGALCASPKIESIAVLGLEQDNSSSPTPVSNSAAKSLRLSAPVTCAERHSIGALQSIMEEFESSLMIPQWTSTPGNASVHRKIPLCSKSIVPIDLSRIPAVESRNPNGALLKTPSDSLEKTATYFNSRCVDLPNIHLFDSPPKKVIENKRKHPACKKIVLDFHEQQEVTDDLEEGVLKPRKSYHSPDVLTRHIIRVKRAFQQQQSHPAKQSKSEQLMAKMNREFDEIDSLELCIE